MPGEPLTEELMKALMTPKQFYEWQHRTEQQREFWRTLQGPAQRPLGSNADEWHLFLSENKECNAGYFAVQIAEAIDEAEQRGYARGKQRADVSADPQ